MAKTTAHLDDEHMMLYEWSGAGTGAAGLVPRRSKRTHPWHASYAVLALLTSLLTLGGCSGKDATEQAGEQVDQALREQKAQPDAAPPMPEATPMEPAPGTPPPAGSTAGSAPQQP